MKELEVTLRQIKESKLYQSLMGIISSQEDLLYLTCYTGLCTAVSFADKKVYPSEIKFILNHIPNEINFPENSHEKMLAIIKEQVKYAKSYSTVTPHFIKYLVKHKSESELKNIFTCLISLCLADDDLAHREQSLLLKIAKRFKLNLNEVKSEIEHAHRQGERIVQLKEKTITLELNADKREFEEKRFLKDLKISHQMELEKKFAGDKFYLSIAKMCNNAKPRDQFFISSYLATVFMMISVDREIAKKEVDYAKAEFLKWYRLQSETLDKLVDYCLFLSEMGHSFKEHWLEHTEVIRAVMDKSEMKRFLIILFNLANQDEDVTSDELLLIEKISQEFNFDSSELQLIKDQALGIDGSFKILRSASSWDMV